MSCTNQSVFFFSCIFLSSALSQFVVSVRNTIVLNVLTPTFVGINVKHILSDIMCY